MNQIQKFRKNSLRLKDFDYSQNASYFITVCVFEHIPFFGKILNNKIILNSAGKMVLDLVLYTENHFVNLAIDEYIIMPNHIHAILIITDDKDVKMSIQQNRKEIDKIRNMLYVEPNQDSINKTLTAISPNQGSINRTPTISEIGLKSSKIEIGKIVRFFKAKSSYELHRSGYQGFRWQRNFYDHIIRNFKDYENIKDYIFNNPLKWTIDKYFAMD